MSSLPPVLPVTMIRDNDTEVVETVREYWQLRWEGYRVVGTFIPDTSNQLVTEGTLNDIVNAAVPVVNVRKHGALGNGTADDTAAIQAAIDSLPLNPAGDGILSPSGFANGGTLFLPKGRYVISSTLNLRRGIRIVGEGRESTQIISKTPGSVIRYADSGRYIQDEIVIENLSIWQHSSVVATSGAAIDVGFGSASIQSTRVICRNIYVEKTYTGYLLEAGVASTFENCDASQCVSHGFDIRYTDGVQSVTTTSTSFISCYSSINGGDGFHVTRGSYLHWTACASDSNAGYGYYLDGTAGAFIQGGCEENTTGGVYLQDTEGITLSINVIHATGATAKHAITLSNARTTALIGGYLSAGASITGYALNQAVAGGPVTIIGTSFVGPYSTNRANFTAKLLHLSGGFGLVGDTNNWAIGTAQSPDAAAVFNVGGLADSDSDAGLKANVTHTGPGASRNSAALIQALTANTALTYPLLLGLYIPAAAKGAASTVTRQAGVYIAEASTGATANAALMVDAGTGTVPAGNWGIFYDGTRDSVFKGPIRLKSTTGPTVRAGTGTPEGAVSAAVGSVYLRDDGAAGTTTYIKESGSGTTGWMPLSRTAVNVRDYGAVGNGTTDDAAAFNAAITAAGDGGTVIVPFTASGYALNSAVNISKAVTLQGQGMVKLKAGGSARATALVNIQSTSTAAAIRGFTCDANSLLTSAILTVAGAGGVVADCVVDGSGVNNTVGIQVATTTDARVENNTITGVFQGIFISGINSRLKVRGNRIKSWRQRGIYVLGTSTTATDDLVIDDNRITDLAAGGTVRYPIFFTGDAAMLHTRIRVSNNRVVGPGTAYLDGTTPGTADQIALFHVKDFQITGNISTDGGDMGITCDGTSTHGVVANNVCLRNNAAGIDLGSATYAVSNITVTGNTCMNNGKDRLSALAAATEVGIRCYAASKVAISGNTLGDDDTASQKYGVAFTNCTNIACGPDVDAGNVTGLYRLETGNTNINRVSLTAVT